MSTTTLQVSGMTCDHCVRAVTQELTELDGVSQVQVALVAGGTSTVTVTSPYALAPQSLRDAVAEAGYVVVDG